MPNVRTNTIRIIFGELHGKPVPDPEPTSFDYTWPTPEGRVKLVVGDYFWGPKVNVFSRRIADVLAPMNIEGTQIIPATVTTYKGEILNDFHYVHIYHHIGAMDKEKSDYKLRPSGAYSIDRVVLDREVLGSIPLEERLVFVLEEKVTTSLFHRSVVDAILASDPVGVVFQHCETKKRYTPGEE